MTVAIHKTTGTGTTGANMFGTFHADKESTIATGILYSGGGGGTETSWQGGSDTNPNIANTVLRYLTRDTYAFRFLTYAVDWDWGNQTVVDRIDDAFTEASANHDFDAGQAHLVAASMGCCCALNWAQQNPSKVASISLMLPAVDQQDIEDNNRVGQYGLPEPSTAFGGSPVPDAYCPARNTADFVDIPIKMWYSNDDTVCNVTVVEAFGTAVGAEMVNLGDRIPYQTGFAIPGHDASNLDPVQMVQWITFLDVASHVLTEPSDYVHSAGRGQ